MSNQPETGSSGVAHSGVASPRAAKERKDWSPLRTWLFNRVINDYTALTSGGLAAEARAKNLLPDDWYADTWNRLNTPRTGTVETMAENHPRRAATRDQRVAGGVMAMVARILATFDKTQQIGAFTNRRASAGLARWQTFRPGVTSGTVQKRLATRYQRALDACNQVNHLAASGQPASAFAPAVPPHSPPFAAEPVPVPHLIATSKAAEPQAVVPVIAPPVPVPVPVPVPAAVARDLLDQAHFLTQRAMALLGG